MRKKPPIVETNRYLRDAAKREKQLITNVASSTSVETGRKTKDIARTLRNPGATGIKNRK